MELVISRDKCILAIRHYRELITDVLNYMRYFESTIMYKNRLEEAILERDQETQEI